MKKNLRKIIEVAIIVVIIAVSVLIFINRKQLKEISEVSYLGLFGLCFLANSTVLLPAPSLLLAATCGLIMNPFLVAIVAAAGSSFGEFVGYAFGRVSQDLSPGFQKILNFMTTKVKKDWLIVFLLAVLPVPFFDIAGIYCGGTKMHPVKFFLFCFMGKFIKTLIYVLFWRYVDVIYAWVSRVSGMNIPVPALRI